MTPDQIEEALEQPEFNKPLQELAKARIAFEPIAENYYTASGGTFDSDEAEAMTETLDEREYEYFENMALPFGDTADHEDSAAEIIREVYKGIKANLLKPENRLKEALS